MTAIKLYHSGEHSISAIVNMTDVSRATLYRYLAKERAVVAQNVRSEEEGRNRRMSLRQKTA